MKKFKLSTQLLILIGIILIVTSALFGVLLFNRMDDLAEASTLNSLTTGVSSSKEYWDTQDNKENFSIETNKNFDVAFIRLYIYSEIGPREGRPEMYEIYNISTNYNEILSNEIDAREIVKTASLIPGSSGSAKKKIMGTYYYIAYETSNNNMAFILITNSSYANSMKRSWTMEIIIMFISSIMVAAIIIFFWSKYYTNRLFRLTTHIKNLDKNNYEGVYTESGNDELSLLTNSVEEMRQVLKEGENVKQEILQNVSHDFKTPISVIRGYAEAIRDGVEDVSQADIIIAQADILQAKVYKLLQYNRLEYLKKDEEFKEIHMKPIIENVILNYKNIDNVSIETDLDDTIFYGYEENYYTVVDNIMENAKRYAKSVIRITLKGGYLRFYNDGDHIDEKFINSAFKAYEKGDKGQFGLGMSIVQKTLDFFDYEISVCNKDVGCEFTINKKPNQNVKQL